MVDGVDVSHATEGVLGMVVEDSELSWVAPLRRRVAHEEQSRARSMESLPKINPIIETSLIMPYSMMNDALQQRVPPESPK